MRLLRTEWDNVEADFTRFYGRDLRALCWGESRWSVRRLFTHVTRLPRESALVRANLTPENEWETTHELLAGLIDVVRTGNANLMRAWGADVEFPEPLPRPGQKPKTVSLAEFAATL